MKLELNHVKISKYLELEFIDTRLGDTGTYYCINKGQVYSIFDLQVVRDEPREVVVSYGMQLSDKRFNQQDYAEHNLILRNIWSDESDCNKCDSVGTRQKIAICHVFVGILSSLCHIFKHGFKHVLQKKDDILPSVPVDPPYLTQEFKKSGIPCRSSLWPTDFKNLSFHNISSLVVYTFCRTFCNVSNKNSIYNITMTHVGKKIPTYKRIKAQEGATVVLSCKRCQATGRFANFHI